ncbi:MAG: hypothetical protein BM556_08525 [Bacteriovorax sp. MedPE-SWde]|nr:MAG: hypothetical protein BM556_08525 [Bacteriovorax sp. MedPE-SWde]
MPKAYKRSIFIVDPKFQIKFSLMICLVMLISSAFYPLVIYQLISNLTEKFPGSAGQLEEMKESLKMVLILWQLGFGLVTFIICILFTHKIAGPMYKLKKYLTNLRDGRIEGSLYFRGGDYFQDVADEVNETVSSFQEQFKEDTVYLSEASSYLKNLSQTVPDDKKIVIGEIVHKLEDIEERFEELIG